MRRILTIALLLAAAATGAAGQGAFYGARVTGTGGQPGSLQPVIVLPGSLVYVCAGVASGATTCTAGTAAQVYSNVALNATLSQPLVADGAGHIPFWATPGSYYLTATPPTGLGAPQTWNVTMASNVSPVLSVTTPAPYPPATVAVTGFGTPGQVTYYYWVVSDFTLGNSAPSAAAKITNAPATLNTQNYEQVSWTSTGANTYDVLRTATPAAPTGACACAVATAVSALTANDQSNGLSAYTVSTYASDTTFRLTNVAVGAGESQLDFAADNGSMFAIDNKFGPLFAGAIYYATNLAAAIAAIGSSQATLVCSTAQTLTGALTLPSNITFRPTTGCMVNGAGHTLTLHGPVVAGNYEWIGTASASFAGDYYGPRLNVDWWGAVGDDSTDSTAAVQAAMTASEHSAGSIVYVPTGTYLVGNIQAGDPATKATGSQSTQAPGAFGVVGDGRFVSVLKAKTGTTGFVLQRNNTAGVTYSDFGVDGSTVAKGADFSWLGGSPSTSDVFERLLVESYVDMGLDLDNQNDAPTDSIQLRQGSSSSSGDFVALSNNAGTGQVYLSNIAVNSGVVTLTAQSGQCSTCNFLGGVEFPQDSTNNWTFNGGQIWADPFTGIAFNLTNDGEPGTYGMMLNSIFFNGTSAYAVFAGNLGDGFICNGCIVEGTATLFGTTGGADSGRLLAFDHSVIPSYTVPSGASVRTTATLVNGVFTDNPIFSNVGAGGGCSALVSSLNSAWSSCWNYSGGNGESDFFADKGAGSLGGFAWYDRNAGTPTLLATLSASTGLHVGGVATALTSQLPGSGSVTTAAATTDAVTITWPDGGSRTPGHCSLAATNASGATNIATTYISAKASDAVTLTHAATASMTYDVVCTVN